MIRCLGGNRWKKISIIIFGDVLIDGQFSIHSFVWHRVKCSVNALLVLFTGSLRNLGWWSYMNNLREDSRNLSLPVRYCAWCNTPLQSFKRNKNDDNHHYTLHNTIRAGAFKIVSNETKASNNHLHPKNAWNPFNESFLKVHQRQSLLLENAHLYSISRCEASKCEAKKSVRTPIYLTTVIPVIVHSLRYLI